MPSRFSRVLITIVAVLFFLAAMAGAAWLGVKVALKTLPESAIPDNRPAIGETLSLDARDEPIYLAESVQGLRDFFFAHPDPERRRDGDAEARGLRRVFEPLDARIIALDADAIEIEVTSGPLSGLQVWIHESQLSEPPSADTRPNAETQN